MTRPILDLASGSRMFYFNANDPRVVFGDCRTHESTLCDGRKLEIKPDILMDFRNLPYEAETLPCVVFDPPHLRSAGRNGWMAQKYGSLGDDWREYLRDGFAECFRVLKPFGTLIFKWNENDIPLLKILSLTPEKPVLGHKTGKRMNTHWVLFIKNEVAA